MISSFAVGRFGAAAASTLALAIALAAPLTVLAHAELETATPADGAALTEPPTEIVLTFSEVLDPAKSSIVVAEAGGAQVASGGSVDTTGDATRMTLALPPLAAGEYEIRWTSASAVDGDLDRGTTRFSYAPPAPTPTASPTPSATPSSTPPASPASSPTRAPGPTPSADGSASSSTDVIIPIVAAVIVLAGLGGWLLSRSRGRGRA